MTSVHRKHYPIHVDETQQEEEYCAIDSEKNLPLLRAKKANEFFPEIERNAKL